MVNISKHSLESTDFKQFYEWKVYYEWINFRKKMQEFDWKIRKRSFKYKTLAKITVAVILILVYVTMQTDITK
jgi:hypothetical protein